MPRTASLSLDLDDKWAYLKTHGDEGWETFPSYLDLVIPRMLRMFDDLDVKVTVFVVGQDAALESNQSLLRTLVDTGHEIANHSFNHEPWLHLYDDEQLVAEFDLAERAIERATNQRPVGFRGPGFSSSPRVLRELARRGYEYDGTTFPTFIGPLARLYYFMTARLSAEERSTRKNLFGDWWEGFRSMKPYYWRETTPPLLEIPVTTMPLFRTPIHLSYIQYAAGFSRRLAMTYFRAALMMCRTFRVEPSILLHPLDFLGCDDDTDLGFFPGMKLPASAKLPLTHDALRLLTDGFDVVTMDEHARRIKARLDTPQTRAAVTT